MEKPLTEKRLKEIGEKSGVDYRTLLKVLAGMPVRGRAGVRAAQALKAAGFAK